MSILSSTHSGMQEIMKKYYSKFNKMSYEIIEKDGVIKARLGTDIIYGMIFVYGDELKWDVEFDMKNSPHVSFIHFYMPEQYRYIEKRFLDKNKDYTFHNSIFYEDALELVFKHTEHITNSDIYLPENPEDLKKYIDGKRHEVCFILNTLVIRGNRIYIQREEKYNDLIDLTDVIRIDDRDALHGLNETGMCYIEKGHFINNNFSI